MRTVGQRCVADHRSAAAILIAVALAAAATRGAAQTDAPVDASATAGTTTVPADTNGVPAATAPTYEGVDLSEEDIKELQKEKQGSQPVVAFDASAWYAEGDYGATNADTETWYYPASVSLLSPFAALRGTIAYIKQKSESDVTILAGRVFPNPPTTTNVHVATTNEGFGDVTVDLTIYGPRSQSPEYGNGFNLLGDVKIPTADEDDNLGTGETDYSAGVSLWQWLGRHLVLGAEGRYTWIGDTEDFDYENQRYGSGSLGIPMGNHVFVRFAYERRTALVEDVDDSETASGTLDLTFSKNFSISGTGEIGLSDTAADWAANAGLRIAL